MMQRRISSNELLVFIVDLAHKYDQVDVVFGGVTHGGKILKHDNKDIDELFKIHQLLEKYMTGKIHAVNEIRCFNKNSIVKHFAFYGRIKDDGTLEELLYLGEVKSNSQNQ